MAPAADVANVQPDSITASLLDAAQTLKAAKALLQHIHKAEDSRTTAAPKRNLLTDSDAAPAADVPILLTLTTKKHIVDTNRLKPGKIVLPHPLHNPSNKPADDAAAALGAGPTICLITADPQRAYKNAVSDEVFPRGLAAQITRVIGVGKLKAKFSQYEAQRQLYASHDVFLADDRIINRLPAILGKTFYRGTAKRPIPVVLAPPRDKVDGKRVKAQPKKKKGKNEEIDKDEEVANARIGEPAKLATEIERAVGAALVHLSPSTNTSIKVGYAGWAPEQIAANVEAVAAVLVDRYVPQKWNNVRSLYIKGPETAALPIWMTDELWMDEGDFKPEGEEETEESKAIEGAEKANVGKKRKSAGAAAETAKKQPPAKKLKASEVERAETDKRKTIGDKAAGKKEKVGKTAAMRESNDDKLDAEISKRKAKLKKQKAAAKEDMDD